MAKSFGKGPWRRICAFAKAEGGTALGVSAFSFLVLATASGVVIDAGRGYLIKSRLTQAVDSAALASGRVLSDADGKGNSYQSQVQKYFQANFPDGYLGIDASAANLKVKLDGDSLNVSATVQVDSAVMSIIGMDGYSVSASATVSRTACDDGLAVGQAAAGPRGRGCRPGRVRHARGAGAAGRRSDCH